MGQPIPSGRLGPPSIGAAGSPLEKGGFSQTGSFDKTAIDAASALYHGEPGNAENSSITYGMPWSQASGRLNWVPAPGAEITLTMTDYADAVYSNAVAFAKAEHMPKNF